MHKHVDGKLQISIVTQQRAKLLIDEGAVPPLNVSTFYKVVRSFFETAVEYSLKNLPHDDAALENVRFINFEQRMQADQLQAEYFVMRYVGISATNMHAWLREHNFSYFSTHTLGTKICFLFHQHQSCQRSVRIIHPISTTSLASQTLTHTVFSSFRINTRREGLADCLYQFGSTSQDLGCPIRIGHVLYLTLAT